MLCSDHAGLELVTWRQSTILVPMAKSQVLRFSGNTVPLGTPNAMRASGAVIYLAGDTSSDGYPLFDTIALMIAEVNTQYRAYQYARLLFAKGDVRLE